MIISQLFVNFKIILFIFVLQSCKIVLGDKMKVLYNGKEKELDDNNIKGRDEFDTLTNVDMEDTIELNIKDINNYQSGDDNG